MHIYILYCSYNKKYYLHFPTLVIKFSHDFTIRIKVYEFRISVCLGSNPNPKFYTLMVNSFPHIIS